MLIVLQMFCSYFGNNLTDVSMDKVPTSEGSNWNNDDMDIDLQGSIPVTHCFNLYTLAS